MRTIDEIKDLVKEIKKYLSEYYGAAIREVMVYGSFARGEATEDSDIDVVIIVADDLDPNEVEERLSDLLFNFLLDRKELVSVIAIHESMFKNYKSPFILNTKEEGVLI